MESQVYISSAAKAISSLRLVGLVGAFLLGSLSLPCAAQAPAAQAPKDPPVTSITLPSYRVNPGDVLEISVFDKPELSKQVLIPPDGKVQYAFVEEFVAAQLTLKEIKDRLTTELSKQLNRPQVSVSIVKRQIHEVSVLGAVKTAGKRPLGDNWRVLDLIADSGGLAVARPDWATATLVRGSGTEAISIDLAKLMTSGSLEQNPLLLPGDVLLIKEIDTSRVSVEILGEVMKPGTVLVPSDGSFASIITSVGGFKPRASLLKVKLTRDGKDTVLDMRDTLTTGKVLGPDGAEVKALPGDKLLIAENKLSYGVVGAVNRGGTMIYPESEEVTILSALNMAGGAHPQADLKNAVLVHAPIPGEKVTGEPINLEDMIKKDNLVKNSDPNKAKNDKNKTPVTVNKVMKPGEYLYVPAKIAGRRNNFFDVFRNALAVIPVVNLITQ